MSEGYSVQRQISMIKHFFQYRLKAFMRDFQIHLLSRDENDKFHKQEI